jgi:tetratricopeptide (TPR) repeat protein
MNLGGISNAKQKHLKINGTLRPLVRNIRDFNRMKRTLLISLTTITLLTANSAAFGQTDAAQTELDKGVAAAQSGNADSAERAFQSAYNLAKANNDQAKLCQAAFQLGIVQTGLHKTSEAETNLKTALAIAQRGMPANSAFTAVALTLLADLYLTEDKPAQAEPLYVKAIPNLPASPPTLGAEKTINLATCYVRGDKLDLADTTYQKGIALFTAAVGPESAETLKARLNYVLYQFERGSYEKVIENAHQILNSKNVPQDVKASANNVIALSWDKLEKYGRAMHYAQKSLDEFKNSKSSDLVKQSDALLLIGRIYNHGHKYRDAEKYMDQALAILAKSSPDGAPYSDALREKGDLYMNQGQYAKAETFILQSKAIRERLLGTAHSDVAQNLCNLGYIYQQENKYQESESSYKRALEIYKKTRGTEHPTYISTLVKLSNLYNQMNNKAAAIDSMSSALNIEKSVLPADNPKISQRMAALAELYSDNQQPQKAEALLFEAVSRDNKSNAPRTQKAADLDRLAALQKALGKQEEAAHTSQQAIAEIQSLPGAASASFALDATSTPTPTDQTQFANKWCLCIGISNFKDTSINLKYSAKDATDFKNFVIKKGNFQADHVKLLVDENATRQNIIDQLGDGWLAKQVEPDDLVLVYISSHGSQALDEAKGVNFLVTYDTNKNSLLATGIPMQWLSKIIEQQVKSKRTVILLDVCHSGSAADWTDDGAAEVGSASGSANAAGTESGGKGLQRILTSDPQSVVPGAGQVILCSSAKSQVSWESKEYPNGVFTKRLMEALSLNGDRTTISEAYLPLRTNVESEVLKDRGEVQTPQLSGKWSGNLMKVPGK